MSALERLAEELRAERSLLAVTLVPASEPDRLAERVAAGPRAAAAPGDYGLVLAAVREGYLLHYGEARVVATSDPDLALLGGDRLYALGLARLAALGDVAAVAELADLISLCAQAHAEADAAAAPSGAGDELAEAAWEAAASAIGQGPTSALARAKERARAGQVDAAAELRDAARTTDRP